MTLNENAVRQYSTALKICFAKSPEGFGYKLLLLFIVISERIGIYG